MNRPGIRVVRWMVITAVLLGRRDMGTRMSKWRGSAVITPKPRSAAIPVSTLLGPAYNSAAMSFCSMVGIPLCAT
jgi:hypothetical protein